jgi:predicted DNA-binding transcriptional regulator YafY
VNNSATAKTPKGIAKASRPTPTRVVPRTPARTKAPPLGRPPGKFTQHRKLARLHELLEKHPQGLTIPEISAALRLTTRSVRRYLNYLKGREASDALESIPVGPRGTLRWRMNPRDRGRAMNLRRTQAYGLLSVRRAFDPIRGSALFEELEIVTDQITQLARRPVRAGGGADIASDTRMEERFLFVPEAARAQPHKGGELDDLFRAVADLRVLTFRYLHSRRGVRGASTARAADPTGDRGVRMTVHPYAMVLYRGEVHCIGRDVRTGHVEAYALARVRESETSESLHFELPEDFRVDDYVHGPFGLGRATHAIVVEFNPLVADEVRAQRLHASQRFATAPDGRVRLSLSVPSLEEALAWVLRFGASARVIEPPELRDSVLRELKSAMTSYGK